MFDYDDVCCYRRFWVSLYNIFISPPLDRHQTMNVVMVQVDFNTERKQDSPS